MEIKKAIKKNNKLEVDRKEQEKLKDIIVYKAGFTGKSICVLAHLKVCEDSKKDFDRPVNDKSNATYSINKFIVVKIIDEDCNEYSYFFLDMKNIF